jgi:hypothetical protein
MKRSCNRCSKNEFEVPNFTLPEKQILSELKSSKQIMNVISKIESWYKIKFIDAKFSLMHINIKHGECHRCNFKNLEGEYVTCPKCQSLNFNWKL